MEGFRRQVTAAVAAGRKDGELSIREAMRIRASLMLPGICAEMQSLVEAELMTTGVFQGLIDWENFDVEKFAQLVQVVLQILSAFGVL